MGHQKVIHFQTMRRAIFYSLLLLLLETAHGFEDVLTKKEKDFTELRTFQTPLNTTSLVWGRQAAGDTCPEKLYVSISKLFDSKFRFDGDFKERYEDLAGLYVKQEGKLAEGHPVWGKGRRVILYTGQVWNIGKQQLGDWLRSTTSADCPTGLEWQFFQSADGWIEAHVKVSESAPPPGWFIGHVGVNCDDACQKMGLECRDAELRAHNKDVDSSEKMIGLLKNLDQDIGRTSCFGEYGMDGDTPLVAVQKWARFEFCLHSSPAKESFSCSAKPRDRELYKKKNRRLCYCVPSTGAKGTSCSRPNAFCKNIQPATLAGEYNTASFQWKDCNADGIPDPTCSYLNGDFWIISSADGCHMKGPKYQCKGAKGTSCSRPNGFCKDHQPDTLAGEYNTASFQWKDCDADGIPDPTCSYLKGDFLIISSADGCHKKGPKYQCKVEV